MAAIKEKFDGSRGYYGARKIWCQLRREGYDIARCTVKPLMKTMGLQGVVRGKKVITTNPDAAQPCPEEKVNRALHCADAEPALGFGFHLCLKLERHGLRGRRLAPARLLAGESQPL